MPIHDTGQKLLSDAVIRLIASVWQTEIYDVVNEKFVATIANKGLAIKVLNKIIEASHDVLLEGVTERRIKPASGEEVDMTEAMVAEEFKEWMKGLCLKIGYDDKPGSKHYYLHGNLYNFGLKLREICQANPAALQSTDVQWDVAKFGPLPTRADTLAFLKPQLLKINTALDYIYLQNNVVEAMQYINDVLTEVFYPELEESRLPELILAIIGQHPEPKKKEAELEKCIRAFYHDIGAAEKAAGFKELYLKLDNINTQLGKKGFGVQELNEASEDYNQLRKMMKLSHTAAIAKARASGKKGAELLPEVNRLMRLPIDPFPKQDPQLSVELARAFKIDMTDFADVGTDKETKDVTEKFKHLKIARIAYEAATTMSSSPQLLAYKDSAIPAIALLAEKVLFREAFLNKVLADEAKTSQKAK